MFVYIYMLFILEYCDIFQVITNEANGYSIHTGAFTCPEGGLYLFTFSVGQRGSNQVWAYLQVNGVNVIDAVSESMGSTDDDQGSNTVVLRLQIGDTVWISGHDDHHIEGSETFRITSFTGVYLYP